MCSATQGRTVAVAVMALRGFCVAKGSVLISSTGQASEVFLLVRPQPPGLGATSAKDSSFKRLNCGGPPKLPWPPPSTGQGPPSHACARRPPPSSGTISK